MRYMDGLLLLLLLLMMMNVFSASDRTAKDCKKQVRSSRCSFSKFWKFQRSSLEDKWFIWCSNIRLGSEKLIQVGPFSLFSLGRAVSKSLGWTCGFLQTAPSSLRRLMFWNRGVKQIRCKCPVMSTPGSDAEALMLLWCQKINIFFVWMLLQLCWVVEVSNEIWAPYNTIIQPCKSLCFERVKWKERIWSGLYVFERWVLVKASEEIEQRTVFSQSLLSITWIFPYTFIHSHKCHLQTFQKHIFIFSITKCIQLLNCLFSKSFENENKHDVMVGFVSEIYIVDGWRTMMLPWVFSAQ